MSWRNSMIPVVTAIGMHLGEMLGGAVLVENIFSWPGSWAGFAVQAVFNRDYPVLQCFILMMTVIFVLCNLCVGYPLAIIDPRIRLAGDRSCWAPCWKKESSAFPLSFS
jgi:nickel transport system permease protein